MAYTEIVGDLGYITIYQDIMKASTGQGSAYIKAKETIVDYVDKGQLDEREKSALVVKHITELAQGITTQALNAAIQIAKENREAPYLLAKLRADTELTQANKAKLEVDKNVATATVAKLEADIKATIIGGWKVQADIYSKNGLNAEAQLITNPILGVGKLGKNTMATDYVNGEQGKASIYSTLASSAKKDGNVTITTDSSGHVSNLVATTPNNEILTGAQIDVAVRQEQAFDDNKVQHAVNASSTFLSMLLSTENSILIGDRIDIWDDAMGTLLAPNP